MTFTHKLARRLARLRPHALSLLSPLILLAGCAAGEPTSANTTIDDTDTGGPVVLNPRSVVLEGTQGVIFRAFDSPLPGSAEVTSIEWTATGGNIGSDGSFSAAETGEFKVIGKRRRVGNPHDRPDTSVVIVVPPQPSLEGLTVSPASATVGAGLQQTFTAVGRLTDGDLVSVGVTWTATGGTIDAGGVYTSGNTAGTYQVTATHSTTGLTATASVTIPAPAAATLLTLKLSPASISIPVATSVQFSTVGTLSDGSTASVPVIYTATGGTISYSGLYRAGSTAGTYRVIATAAGSTRADTTPVSVTSAPAPPPPTSGGLWRNETFSTYTSDAHWRSDPWDWMPGAPTWWNQDAIHIDRSVTYDGHPTLRYDWPAPPDGDASYWCGKDITREAGYRMPDVPEVWIEVVHKFAPTFNTNSTSSGGSCGVGQYKFLLIWRKWTSGDRFGLSNGTRGREWWASHAQTAGETAFGTNCSGIGWNCRLGYGTGQEQYLASVPGPLWDGQWHTYRVHIKLPTVKGENTGVHEMWIDGKLVKRVTGADFIRPDGQWSNRLDFIGLGSNSNSGTTQATSNWWGHLKVWTSNPGW
ncbi:MAG: hypothetical protein ACREOF_03235 [Gemmatimonadales bacterium]